MSKLEFLKIYFCSIKNPGKIKKKKKKSYRLGENTCKPKTNTKKPSNSQNSAVKEPKNLTGKWTKDMNRLFTKWNKHMKKYTLWKC